MSALAHLAASGTQKYPTRLPAQQKRFVLPDGTEVQVHIELASAASQHSHLGVQGGDPSAPLTALTLSSSTSSSQYLGHPSSSFQLVPPYPPYPNPSSEPDDNTLATRSRRVASSQLLGNEQDVTIPVLWNWFYLFFNLWPAQEFLTLCTRNLPAAVVRHCLDSGLAAPHPSFKREAGSGDVEYLLVSRAAFWQGLGSPSPCPPWVLPQAPPTVYASLLASNPSPTTADIPPVKPKASAGPLYSRYIPALDSTLTFRVLSSENAHDVDLITQWHASDRVNEGWRQRDSRAAQLATIQAMEQNPYTLGLIGEWDGEPWGYVEVYHAKQSNISPFYTATPQDRGFHALVGNESFRGPHRVRAWMGSLLHLLFLLDPNTHLCVSEPRLSNTKMVEYECMCGGHVEKWIDLAHKRAALVFFPRERFFQLCPLLPLPEHVRPVSNDKS